MSKERKVELAWTERTRGMKNGWPVVAKQAAVLWSLAGEQANKQTYRKWKMQVSILTPLGGYDVQPSSAWVSLEFSSTTARKRGEKTNRQAQGKRSVWEVLCLYSILSAWIHLSTVCNENITTKHTNNQLIKKEWSYIYKYNCVQQVTFGITMLKSSQGERILW